MTLYAVLRLVHVGVAVMGLGSIASLAILARPKNAFPLSGLGSLTRLASLSLVLVFATGAAIDFALKGAYHEAWWFRLSGLALIATGATIGYARRSLRRGLAGKVTEDVARSSAGKAAALACAMVTFIVYLMERRPFS